MTTDLVRVDAPDNLFLVALAPSDVPKAQAQLRDWCQATIASLRVEQSDLLDSAATAKRNNWQHSTLTRKAQEKTAEIEYYQKILAAVEEGYLIVPNFDVEVMAVKVHPDADTPPHSRDSWSPRGLTQVDADISMPAGYGQYVSPRPTHRLAYRDESKDPNKTQIVRYFVSKGLAAPKFPVVGVKPIILEATAHAMSKLIFDQIGVVTGKKQDPVVIGTIFHPGDRSRQRRVSFFVAWWLDTRSL